MLRKFYLSLILVLGINVLGISPVFAIGEVLIDTELNNTIRVLTAPMIKASGLNPRYFKFHIISIPQVNAVTTSDGNIYINSGLMINIKDVNAFQGVIAHEMGHAAEEHIPRTIVENSKTFYATTAALLVVIPLSILALPASVLGTTIFGSLLLGTSTMMNLQLAYARANETIADNYALRILRQAKIDPYPFLNLMQQFANYEPDLGIWVFFQTHPQSTQRLHQLKVALEQDPYTFTPTTKTNQIMYARMRVKLDAYLHSNAYIKFNKKAEKMPLTKVDPVVQYGLAMAYFVQGQYPKAQKYLSNLRKISPKDPFYKELQADMYKAQGNVKKAIPLYTALLKELPWADAMRMDYASLLLMSKSSVQWKEAIMHLNKLQNVNTNQNPYVWYLYLKAYGKLHNKNRILMARAKYNQIIGHCVLARKNAYELKKFAKKDTQEWIVANDVILACKNFNEYIPG